MPQEENIAPTTRAPATPEEAAYVFLEQAKQELSRDKMIAPSAVLVYGTGQGLIYDLTTLIFAEETKRAVFQELVSTAREKSASAIITVTQARFGRVDKERPWKDCIFVTVSGPGIDTITLRLPYTTSGWLRRIRFGELQRKIEKAPLSFLPGWPS
jgi:hypothetical protein